ncbi:hypothetical protein GCM10023149_21300 [Mucilaginibacter gynuensis]|uniref:Uncharacterized protein n=1 Tax=Mucilaginibacter gynuensis TaxID=1302236 RepID=A0ABP8GBV9_9SPHI
MTMSIYITVTQPNPSQSKLSKWPKNKARVTLKKRKANSDNTTATKSVITSAIIPLALSTP